MKTIIEPFRIKSVEPIRMTTRRAAARATCARRRLQPLPHPVRRRHHRPAHRLGHRRDEQRAVGRHHARRRVVRRRRQLLPLPRGRSSEITGLHNVLPTHQGRASERILVEVMIGPGHAGAERSCPTTRTSTRPAPTSSTAARRRSTCSPTEGRGPRTRAPVQGQHRHRARSSACSTSAGDDVPFVMVTVTCNSNGGQPVSLENLRAVRAIVRPLRQAALPRRLPLRRERLVHQAARARPGRPRRRGTSPARCSTSPTARRSPPRRTAWSTSAACCCCATTRRFRRAGEPAHPDRGLRDLRRPGRPRPRGDGRRASTRCSTRTTCATASAPSSTSASSSAARRRRDRRAAGRSRDLHRRGRVLPAHPARASSRDRRVACALYEHGGVRSCEIGSVMMGEHAAMELVRLAIPRRTYTQSHIDYVVEVVLELATRGARRCGASASSRSRRRCGTSRRGSHADSRRRRHDESEGDDAMKKRMPGPSRTRSRWSSRCA